MNEVIESGKSAPLSQAQKAEALRPDMPLEDLLVKLCEFGKPRVGMYGSGWHCHIDMHVASVGTSFEVKSEFGHGTPLVAARECANRVIETLKRFA
jgi:hypothetical protein